MQYMRQIKKSILKTVILKERNLENNKKKGICFFVLVRAVAS